MYVSTASCSLAKVATIRISGRPRRQRQLRIPRVAHQHHPLLAITLAVFLRRQKPEAIRQAQRYLAALKKGELITGLRKTDETTAAITLDWSELTPPVESALSDIYHATGKTAWHDTGASGPFDKVNEDAAQYAADRAAEMVGKKWVDGELVDNPNAEWVISDTTRDELREMTERAFRDGLSPAQLADQIEESYDFSEARANAIARTEVATAQSEAALDAWRESGLVSTKRALNGSNPCPICVENADIGDIPLEEPFPSGHLMPPFHVRCADDVAASLA